MYENRLENPTSYLEKIKKERIHYSENPTYRKNKQKYQKQLKTTKKRPNPEFKKQQQEYERPLHVIKKLKLESPTIEELDEVLDNSEVEAVTPETPSIIVEYPALNELSPLRETEAVFKEVEEDRVAAWFVFEQ